MVHWDWESDSDSPSIFVNPDTILFDIVVGVVAGLALVTINLIEPKFAIGIPFSYALSTAQASGLPIVFVLPLLVIIIAPFCEEVLRKIAYNVAGTVIDIFSNKWAVMFAVATIAEAFFFMFLHYSAYGLGNISGFISAFIFVLATNMTVILAGHKSIIPSIVMHILFNAIILGQKLVVVGV